MAPHPVHDIGEDTVPPATDAADDPANHRLGRRVRPIAVLLVDAFGVSPEMLRSPDLVG